MTETKEPALIRPFELRPGQRDWRGHWSADDVWSILSAARDGDAQRIRALLVKDSTLVDSDYWYTPPLHLAVREGHLDVVKVLIEAGADTTHRSLDGSETLADFARDRSHSSVANYLEQLNPRMFASDRPIHDAIKSRNLDTARELLKESAQLADAPGSLGRTPLHYAVETEDAKLVRLLLDHGAAVDTQGFSSDDRLGGHGFRPVALALWHHPYWRQRNCYEIARLLIDNGAHYSLPIAAAFGDEDRVQELLVGESVDPNYEEPGGKRAISAAAERNHLHVVRTLLDHGAQPNLPEGPNCPRGYALWSAARFGYMEMAKLLLEHGADPNAPVESSGSPTESAKDTPMRNLLYRNGGRVGLAAHYHQQNLDVIAALLDRCPEKFSETDIVDGFTAAVSNDDEDLVRLLLSREMRLPTHVTGCQTYLWRSLRLAELLLQNGMDPNLPNWQLMRPLHHMAATGNTDAAKLFLEFGADPTLVDEEYRSTPLGWAARKGQFEFAKFLLDHDPSLRDQHPPHEPSWAAPIAWASRRGHREIVDLLNGA